MKTLLRIVAIIALLSVAIAASFLSYDFYIARNAFPARTFVGQIDVSRLTQEAAYEKIKGLSLAKIFTPLFTLEAESTSFSFAPQDIGFELYYKKSVANAFQLTHKDGYFKNLKKRLSRGEIYAPLFLSIKKTRFKSVLDILKEQVQTSPQSAGFALYEKTGEYHIEPEEIGREINYSKTFDNLKATVQKGGTKVPIAINYTYPKIREKDLRELPPIKLMSEYTTKYGSHDSPNRIHNIKLIASWADGTLLMPGDEFSVVKLIGEVTPAKGFKEAYVIIGGELVPQLGGGACQIATTLYNTVALADLEVLQRRNHSFYFSIYPLGRDAGIYPGQLDMRFVNNTKHPILIKTTATNKQLSFRIYGQELEKKVFISAASILGRDSSGQYVPMTLKQVISKGVPFKTFVTRQVKDKQGALLEKETISSFYRLYGDGRNVPVRRREAR
ncbi:MAG: VanW family protein [bacterium]